MSVRMTCDNFNTATTLDALTELTANTVDIANVDIDNDDLSGQILRNRFYLESVIGRGGMGVVYKARDLRKIEALDQEPYVAIKLLNRKYRQRRQSFIILQREACKTQILSHPNIVNVHDFDRDGDIFLMSMEYLQGMSLSRCLRNNKKGLALKQVYSICKDIASALEYAHSRNIVHCDLKPGNIFLDKKANAKILDFGIARAIQINDKQEFNAHLNDNAGPRAITPAYASCEILQGLQPGVVDDVYALACIIYEMLSGKHPYGRKIATQAQQLQLKPQRLSCLNRTQWKALATSLSFDPSHRPQSVAAFMQQFLPEKKRHQLDRWLYPLSGLALLFAVFNIYQSNQLNLIENTESHVPLTSLSPGQQQQVQELLEIADAHMLVQRYTEPAGGNAYNAYTHVLKIHPGNERALSGLERIVISYEQLADQHINDNNFDSAGQFITEGLKVNPQNKNLLVLQQRLP